MRIVLQIDPGAATLLFECLHCGTVSLPQAWPRLEIAWVRGGAERRGVSGGASVSGSSEDLQQDGWADQVVGGCRNTGKKSLEDDTPTERVSMPRQMNWDDLTTSELRTTAKSQAELKG